MDSKACFKKLRKRAWRNIDGARKQASSHRWAASATPTGEVSCRSLTQHKLSPGIPGRFMYSRLESRIRGVGVTRDRGPLFNRLFHRPYKSVRLSQIFCQRLETAEIAG